MLLAMQKEYLIELGDAVIAVKEANRGVKLNQLFQPVARGAVSGALWGSLIGLLFMMPLAGAAIGAASGALGGKLADLGINAEFMRQAMSRSLPFSITASDCSVPRCSRWGDIVARGTLIHEGCLDSVWAGRNEIAANRFNRVRKAEQNHRANRDCY